MNFDKAKKLVLSAPTLFFASAFVTWPLLAEIEAFELFYEFSRAHEDWDIDEFAMLGFNLTLALIVSILYKSRALKRLAREKEAERARADRHASHDALTGLANRRALKEVMQGMQARLSSEQRTCVAMVDLDRFKPVNDLRGHAVGDAVLSSVAERLREAAGPGAAVARLGGDEFAVLFPLPSSVATVERAARRIVHMMDQPFDVGLTGVTISCSVGLVTWSQDLTVTEVMRRADAALYKAKAEGRAQFAWYDGQLDRDASARIALEAELGEAIKSEEIQPWFQPIVDIETRKLVGFEVLARWNHKEKGHISPEVFVEIAEDCGLIDALGETILRQACRIARNWPSVFTISVNVSPIQFSNSGFVAKIQAALDDCAFDPNRLIIEVTESTVISDFGAARDTLVALKALGVSVALDDFGTGYSSLASLRHLPFDRVKIDRSFLTCIEEEPTNQKIVGTIMDLAKGLGLDVTVEGIETPQQLTFLEGQTGGHGQGYLFEKPMPPEDITWRMETTWADGLIDPDDVSPKSCRNSAASA